MACERAKVRARVVEPDVTRSPETAELARGGRGPETELLEPRAELI
jgi:hypothetical protein